MNRLDPNIVVTCFLVLLVSGSCVAQLHPEWVIPIGGAFPAGVAIDSDGDVVTGGELAGYGIDWDPGPGTYHFQSYSAGYCFYLAKYSSGGELTWAGHSNTTGSGTKYAMIQSVNVGQDNSIQVGGFMKGTNDLALDSSVYEVDGGEQSLFIAQYNQQGTIDWVKIFPVGGNTRCQALSTGSDGSVYFGSWFAGSLDIGGLTYSGGSMQTDAVLGKLDASGNLEWHFVMSGEGTNHIQDIAVSDDHIYVTGSFSSELDFDPGPEEWVLNTLTEIIIGQPEETGRLFFGRYSQNGDLGWMKTVAEDGASNSGKSIAIDEDENIFLYGNFVGATDFDPDTSLHSFLFPMVGAFTTSDVFLTKYDSLGNFHWGRSFGSILSEWTSEVEVGMNSAFVCGNFEHEVFIQGSDPSLSLGSPTLDNENAFLSWYTGEGDHVFAGDIGTDLYDVINGIAIDSTENAVYISGIAGAGTDNLGPVDFDFSQSEFWVDSAAGFVAKYAVPTLAVPQQSTNMIQVFPNPSNGPVWIKISDNHEPIKLEIADLNGRIMKTEFQKFGQRIQVELPESPGIYLIRMFSRNFSEVTKVVKL